MEYGFYAYFAFFFVVYRFWGKPIAAGSYQLIPKAMEISLGQER